MLLPVQVTTGATLSRDKAIRFRRYMNFRENAVRPDACSKRFRRSLSRRGRWHSEDDGLVAIKQHAVLDVPPHRAREHNLLQIAPLADEILNRIAMRHPHHVLLDDGPIVEHLGHVVTCRANQFHAALKRLMVGPSADK